MAAAPQLRSAAVTAPSTSLMKVGTQNDSGDANLKVLAALGVTHVCSTLPSAKFETPNGRE